MNSLEMIEGVQGDLCTVHYNQLTLENIPNLRLKLWGAYHLNGFGYGTFIGRKSFPVE